MPTVEPTEADRAAVEAGALTVAGASEYSGFSRSELFALMKSNAVVWFARGPKRVRFITRASLNAVLAQLLAEHNAEAEKPKPKRNRSK